MKKAFAIIIVSCFLFSCKTAKMATPASAKINKSDTALQGDKLKDATKP